MKKKLLSIAIVLAMVLALMPATALAAGPEGYWSDFVTAEPETGYVADAVAKTVEISTAEGLAWFAKQVNEGTSFADYEITIANNITSQLTIGTRFPLLHIPMYPEQASGLTTGQRDLTVL